MKINKLIIISILGIAILAACTSPAVPTPEVIIATDNPAEQTAVFERLKEEAIQTVQAEQTMEALANPTATPTTEVIVVEPTATTAVATAIPTVAQPTTAPTTANTAAPVITNTPTVVVNADYNCKIESTSPQLGQKYAPAGDFDGHWVVSNTGNKSWDAGSVDFIYISGEKMHTGADSQDISKTVAKGEKIDLILDMLAPRNAGTYQTTWALKAGNVTYCYVSLSIVVE